MECLDSRRLTGPNLLMRRAGAIIDVRFGDSSGTVQGANDSDAVIAEWQRQVKRMLDSVGWAREEIHVRRYRDGASLAISAPVDALYAATEVNDWAWEAACSTLDKGEAPPIEDAARSLGEVIADEQNPALQSLCAQARERCIPFLVDDELISFGFGKFSQSMPVDRLPPPGQVDWSSLQSIPVALVTGTNGKTTSVRMTAAIARAAGLVAGICSTDWIAVDDEIIDRGDYSGPGGARTVLRDGRVELAILETARGGLLRRGLAVERADAVLITNIAEDHLGEFALDDLRALADVKWVVTKAVNGAGRLVLNADDALLIERSRDSQAHITWFSAHPDNRIIRQHLTEGGDALTVEDGHVIHWSGKGRRSLLAVAEIPMTLGGVAEHNVTNALGAAGLALALGISGDAVAMGLRNTRREDHPGRLNVFEFNGVKAIVDFAHNPHGIRALFEVGRKVDAKRRLVLIGQAGDRPDRSIAELADAAWAMHPDRIILKELAHYARGRGKGEVAGILRERFLSLGAPAEIIGYQEQELDGVREAVAWSQPGDVLMLLIHEDLDGVTEYLTNCCH